MSLWTDTRGNMAVLFAMGFAISAVVSAVAVDGAALYHERRMIQNGVDLAALAAAGNPAEATALAQASLVEAGLLPEGSSAGLTVTTGHYDPNPTIGPADRFTPGRAPLNAVAVRLQRRGALYFARGWAEPPELGAMAIASVTPQVSFSLGSRLASLNGGIANGVLNTLLGTNVALDVMDYRNLLGAKVDAFAFLDALAGQLGVTVGTYDDLLALEADHGRLAGALASLLTGVEHTAMLKLAGSAGHNGSVPLAKLFDLGPLGGLAIGSGSGEGLFAAISALDLLTASAGLGDGDRQVALALSAGIPGLVGIDAQLAIGEPPQGGAWFAIGGVGSVVRTAQLRLRVVAEILGSGALVGAPIRLPLYLEMAQAEAVVGAASCPSGAGGKGSATILTRPGVLRLMIGEVDAVRFGDFNTTPVVAPAKLAEVKLLGITVLKVLASSLVEIAQTTPVALGFSSSDIAGGVVRTARTTTMVSSLTGSLLGNMVFDVPVLGLGLNLTGLTGLLNTILAPLTPVLDLTLARLLEPLGLSLGEADVLVYGVRCSHPVLVG
ncbi:TadG family pilus assembly protein [Devosia ginsengisoli]|uniref:TadG family pilus assembly protein n=1 Tax=Devosia ginsengisoli TaxID=400770 RepID=UPI0026EA0CFA|nr:TadG family pilus assembly protein [Devosia ginsengisoli]MCR6670972.1 pilus assembly protein TadG-related protein [Devosia ginsengisoli]